MDSTPPFEARAVLILNSDILYAEALHQLTHTALPRAEICLASNVSQASRLLVHRSFDLLITGLDSSLSGDVLDLLTQNADSGQHFAHVLVTTTHRELRNVTVLRRLSVHGVFDSTTETSEQFLSVLRIVAAGGAYWSQSFLELEVKSHSLSRILTAAEQVMLSVVGDGSDDESAARELGLSPATVSTVRRSLHRKLGVQHRGELIRIAAQNGFVRFTPTGVVRPGFALLVDAWHRRCQKLAVRLAS